MRNTIVDELLHKYLTDDISLDEMQELLKYLRDGHQQELQSAISKALQDKRFTNLAQKGRPDVIFENIMKAAKTSEQQPSADLAIHKMPRRILSHKAIWAAAILAIFMGLGAYFIFKPSDKSNLAQQVHSTKATAFTRYLTLPDGSTVVLQANSNLEYPTAFSNVNREVTLTGEAYFDIRADSKRPFIIHTGSVKTTVLGTAFNVRALPGTHQVTVSVARGKVKVENEKRVIAVLLPDQQVVYSTVTSAVAQKQVNTSKIVTDWTTQDMIFESVPMADVIETLRKRYGTGIAIKNPALSQCEVKVSFSGTETLKDVLAALCTLTGSSMAEDSNGLIVIDGEGCQ